MKKPKHTLLLILLFSLSSLLNCYPVQAETNDRDSDDEYYLSETCAKLLLDDSMDLSVEGVSDEEITFRSKDSSIASVGDVEDNKCTITGASVGKTTINVKIKTKGKFFFMGSSTTLKCKVTVSPKAVSVKFKKNQYKLLEGEKKKVAVILRPSITGEMPVFSSSNPDIATVNTKGKVFAKSKGITIISATIQNGMTARCKIIVSESTTKDTVNTKKNKSLKPKSK